jgi:secondary thiamine-phosphate synthase enzyme
MKELEVRTSSRRQLVTITDRIQEVVRELGVEDGSCHVFVPHTTAAVTINENADPDVAHDIVTALGELVPDVRFHHAEGNSDAHFLSTLIGCSLTVPVVDGRLRLGTWQGVFFVELDGPRTRRVWVSATASS